MSKRTFHSYYESYILSYEWKTLRQKVLRRDGYRCTKCNSKKKLHVHHKTYKRLFNEHLEDLVTLCKHCHEKVHEQQEIDKASSVL
jgi:5-methylcytosine-specific restriction endonuclease McrA